MARARAHVSVDVDPVDVHLAGYGLQAPPCDRVYRLAVPRLLDTLARVGIRATFFVVARDAEAQRDLWRAVVRAGHEIASHSFSHPLPFTSLSATMLARELCESRHCLEAVVGRRIVGFRAPGWDVNTTVLTAVARAGYRYDASVLPSPVYLAGNLWRTLLARGRSRLPPWRDAIRAARAPRLPHRVGGEEGLWEFPVSVSPGWRVPFTHTLWYVAPRPLCRRIEQRLQHAQVPLCYQLHGVDLLELDDGVDLRMNRHPGMRWPLARKRGLLEDVLGRIATTYGVVPYGAALASAGTGTTE